MKTTALIPFLTANVLICVAVIPSIDSVEQAIFFGTSLLLSLGCLFLIASEK